MKKQILFQTRHESYTRDFSLNWVYDHLKCDLIEFRCYDNFDTFLLPCSRKVRLKLLDMMLTISLMVDIVPSEDISSISYLLSDFNHALRQVI